MHLSTGKTKHMTTSKRPLRHKLVVDRKINLQEIQFAGSQNYTIWRNKHTGIDHTIRHLKTYITKTHTKTRDVGVGKMKILRRIAEKTLLDGIRNKSFMRSCGVM